MSGPYYYKAVLGNQTSSYDRLRVGHLKPVSEALETLSLPLIRKRKLMSIFNALEVQIENGGDHPEANHLLLAALRRVLAHHADDTQAAPVLRAIEVFEAQEAERWERIRQGLPIERAAEDLLDDLIGDALDLRSDGQNWEACELFERAWQALRKLHGPETRTTQAFYEKHGPAEWVNHWVGEWFNAMDDLGHDNPLHWRRLGQVLREFDECFPDEPPDTFAWVRENLQEWLKIKNEIIASIPPLRYSSSLPVALSRVATAPGRKPGRNEPCWCGSGRKYKVCHLGADRSLD